MHAYGVFPPRSLPACRYVPVIEGLSELPRPRSKLANTRQSPHYGSQSDDYSDITDSSDDDIPYCSKQTRANRRRTNHDGTRRVYFYSRESTNRFQGDGTVMAGARFSQLWRW